MEKIDFIQNPLKELEEAEELGIEIGSALKKQSNNSYKK